MMGGRRKRKKTLEFRTGGVSPTALMSPPTSSPTTMSKQLSGTMLETVGITWNPVNPRKPSDGVAKRTLPHGEQLNKTEAGKMVPTDLPVSRPIMTPRFHRVEHRSSESNQKPGYHYKKQADGTSDIS
ncbi:hypothetical protein L345_04220, partial [Ophiophagus hannah]